MKTKASETEAHRYCRFHQRCGGKGLPEAAEKFPHVLHEQVGYFQRRKMAAPVKFRPMDYGVLELGKAANGKLDIVREDRDAHRCRAGPEPSFGAGIFIIQKGR